VGATLEQLWLSYNQIGKLGGLEPLTKLRVLYLANNGLREYKELEAVPQTVEVRWPTPQPVNALTDPCPAGRNCHSSETRCRRRPPRRTVPPAPSAAPIVWRCCAACPASKSWTG